MASKNANHIHKFKRINLTRKKGKAPYWVYKCTMPTCSFYISVKLAIGQISTCNRCAEPFVITKETLNGTESRATVLPHCSDCTKRRSNTAEVLTDIADFLENK